MFRIVLYFIKYILSHTVNVLCLVVYLVTLSILLIEVSARNRTRCLDTQRLEFHPPTYSNNPFYTRITSDTWIHAFVSPLSYSGRSMGLIHFPYDAADLPSNLGLYFWQSGQSSTVQTENITDKYILRENVPLENIPPFIQVVIQWFLSVRNLYEIFSDLSCPWH